MGSKNPSAVELMVKQWLDTHTYLLSSIFEQIAQELAPVVAEQSLAELKTRLAGLQTRDDLVVQLEAALRVAQLWFSTDQYGSEEWREGCEERALVVINDALTQLAVYRGCNPPLPAAVSQFLAGADRGGEGGAS